MSLLSNNALHILVETVARPAACQCRFCQASDNSALPPSPCPFGHGGWLQGTRGIISSCLSQEAKEKVISSYVSQMLLLCKLSRWSFLLIVSAGVEISESGLQHPRGSCWRQTFKSNRRASGDHTTKVKEAELGWPAEYSRRGREEGPLRGRSPGGSTSADIIAVVA